MLLDCVLIIVLQELSEANMISENIYNVKVVYGFNSNEGEGKHVFIAPFVFTYQKGAKSLRDTACARSLHFCICVIHNYHLEDKLPAM